MWRRLLPLNQKSKIYDVMCNWDVEWFEIPRVAMFHGKMCWMKFCPSIKSKCECINSYFDWVEILVRKIKINGSKYVSSNAPLSMVPVDFILSSSLYSSMSRVQRKKEEKEQQQQQ